MTPKANELAFLAVVIPVHIDSALGVEFTREARCLQARYVTAVKRLTPDGPTVKVTVVTVQGQRIQATYRPTQYLDCMLVNAIRLWVADLYDAIHTTIPANLTVTG